MDIRRSLFIFLAGTLIFLCSCTPESCMEETEATIKATLYKYSLKKNIAPDSLTVYGLNMESTKIHDNEKNVKIIRFPLNSSADSSAFIVIFNGVTDTIVFRHENYVHLISKECGYTYYHNISGRTFTGNEIDSLPVRKSTITTINEENIRIYY